MSNQHQRGDGLELADGIRLPLAEVTFAAIRARGAGGQHVNTTATAVQLRFDVAASSLPEAWKRRLLALADRRLSADGVFQVRAESRRSQEQNRRDALERLRDWIISGTRVQRRRKATRPSNAARRRRVEAKRRRSAVKALRRSVDD
ncbi:MAG: alternative ribosome rescue aminoacyl-tRNA hydrolase ArfB [Pseudomonadota bacterium]